MSWLDAFSSSENQLPYLDVVGRLLLAAALAGILGFDRESKDRPAGLRTYMLVALASGVFTILTFEIFQSAARGGSSSSDPIRIIEAVTAGVAFLAAGTIIQGRGKVIGITTGAGMWMAGALGVACGAGHYGLAIIAALLAFVILTVLGRVQDWITGEDKQGARPADVIEPKKS